MLLSKGLLTSIQKFFNSAGKCEKCSSKFGQFLLNYEYLGKVAADGKKIRFDHNQKRALHTALIADYGEQLLTCIPEQLDYQQMAALSKQEKLAGIKPNDNYVLIAQHTKPLSCIDDVTVPQGVSLRVAIDQLNLDKISHIVVVENQAVFDHIYRAKLPQQLKNAVFVYRGNDLLSKGCNKLLTLLSEPCQIIAFADYDPAGLKIALTLPKVSYCLFPDLSAALLAKNNIDDYLKQQGSMQFLENTKPASLTAHIQTIKANNLSIKQEHMLALSSNLFLVKL